MAFAKVHSGQTNFLSGQIIDIEIDLSKGLHAFSIVGLPDKAVEESKDRISAAIKNSGFKSPKYKNQKVVISLAPADIRKEGPVFDLAMAIGYLLAAEEIRFNPSKKIFLGELSLDGFLRPITGTLAIVMEAKQKGFIEIFVPKANAAEASLIEGVNIFGAESIAQVIAHVNEKRLREFSNFPIAPKKLLPSSENTTEKIQGSDRNSANARDALYTESDPRESDAHNEDIFLDDIKGQENPKRALEIAAAGGHNILLFGPPGTGKTMLAKTLRTLLPPLSWNDSIEVMAIHSIAGILRESFGPPGPSADSSIERRPPFRSPHHTSSYVSLIGGGAIPKPGEMTLAHRGVLFLDEFPEFDRRVVESLRQPLEEKQISISRLKGAVTFPASFMLVAAMNPCPCGWSGSRKKECTCTPKDRARYAKKISGPLLDRIDLRVEVGDFEFEKTAATLVWPEKNRTGEKSEYEKAREKILKARFIQLDRLKNLVSKNQQPINSFISGKYLDKFAPISNDAKRKLLESSAKLGLSMRTYHRVWRVARTIADLEEAREIKKEHIFEALQFRGTEENN